MNKALDVFQVSVIKQRSFPKLFFQLCVQDAREFLKPSYRLFCTDAYPAPLFSPVSECIFKSLSLRPEAANLNLKNKDIFCTSDHLAILVLSHNLL